MFRPFLSRCIPGLLLILPLVSCKRTDLSFLFPEKGKTEKFTLQPQLSEVSGIAYSRKHNGHIWAHEDNWEDSRLYLYSEEGRLVHTAELEGAKNVDWEEMQNAEGQLWVGDIGGQGRPDGRFAFYVLPEPERTESIVRTFKKFAFEYEDGVIRDAEAFVVAPLSGDIFIFSKSDVPAKLFRISKPVDESVVHKAMFVEELPLDHPVSSGIAPDGKTLVIKTYLNIYAFPLTMSDIEGAVKQPYQKLRYEAEFQGESFTFANHSNTYFTLSERGTSDVALIRYQR